MCIVLCAFVFYFRGLFKHLDAMVFFADALSVGLFALAGASKAYACGEGFVLTVCLLYTSYMTAGDLQNVTNDAANPRGKALAKGRVTPFNDTLVEVKKA